MVVAKKEPRDGEQNDDSKVPIEGSNQSKLEY